MNYYRLNNKTKLSNMIKYTYRCHRWANQNAHDVI